MKHSIRARLLKTFMLLLLALLVFSSAFTFAGMRFLRDAARESEEQLSTLASHSSHEMMISQALDAADSFVTEKALTISQTLESFVRASSEMASYTAYLYEYPERFKPHPVPTPDELVEAGAADGPILHYLPATKDVQGSESQAENALLGNLEGIFSVMYESIPEISSIYTAHESGANIGYDRNAALKTGIGAFDCRNLTWYRSVKETGNLYVSKTYPDSFGRGLTVTLAQPIWVNGKLNGVLGVDLLIESINSEILNTQYGAGGYAILLDGDGDVISAKGLSKEGDSSSSFLGTGSEAALSAMKTKESGYVESRIGQQDVYILYAPVPVTGWKLAVVMPVDEMLKPAEEADQAIRTISENTLNDMDRIIRRLNLTMLGLFLILAAVFAAVVRGVCDRVSQPILTLSRDVENIGDGNLDYTSGVRTGDEIELLSTRFELMTASLRTYIGNLTQVTAERERLGAELGIATKIQASMLPCIFPPFPDRPEFDIYATMIPAKEVGGDFYDFFMVDEDHLMVVIADVSGKGIPAALFMMTSKTLIRTLAQTGMTPAEVLNEANMRLCENNEAGMFVTAWIGLLEISSGRFVYANAGHNAPLLRRKGGEFGMLKSRPGFVLAGMEGVRYQQSEISLLPGDLLYMYTDGVTEAINPDEQLYGEVQLLRTLNQARTLDLKALLSGVKDDIDRFADGTAQFDDITMMALRVDRRGRVCVKQLTVAARIDQLENVLTFIEEALSGRDYPSKTLMQLSLAAEEVFVNIAHYAYGGEGGEVVVSIDISNDPPQAVLVFSDAGKPHNPLEIPDPDITLSAEEREIGGLGIFMVKKNVDETRYKYEKGRNVLTLTKGLR